MTRGFIKVPYLSPQPGPNSCSAPGELGGVDGEERLPRLNLPPHGSDELNPLPTDRNNRGEERCPASTDAGGGEFNQGLTGDDLVAIPHERSEADPLQGDGVEAKVEEDWASGTLNRHAVPTWKELRHAPRARREGKYLIRLNGVNRDPTTHDPLCEDGVGEVAQRDNSPRKGGEQGDRLRHSALHLAAHLRLNVV